VRTKRLWSMVTIMSLLLILVGCSNASKAPEPSNPTTPTTPPVTVPAKSWSVKLAPGPKGGVLFLSEMVAEGLGGFKDQGINLSVLNTPGGNEAAKALMSGEADFATLALDHVLKNRAQGADLVVVAFLTKNPALTMIVQPDLQGKVKSIKDLKGMKVGVSSLGGGTHLAVLSLMKQAGMNPTDIEFVAAKDKLADMWGAKQISAAMHVDPQITDLVGANKAWILYDLRTDKDTLALYGTEYPLGTLVTRQEVIQKDPELVQRMVNAILAANSYIKTHKPSEIAAKVPAEYKGDSKLYEQMVEKNIEGLSLTGSVSQAGMETVLKELHGNKVIPADATVDINTSINMSFVAKAPK
jgi:NitT/TauT family transport system substrate-binding protein